MGFVTGSRSEFIDVLEEKNLCLNYRIALCGPKRDEDEIWVTGQEPNICCRG